ncbi:TetR/AcrR family transcriptional regulator [Brevundimonas aveniformis]|uniref:TetR/AcrR family transcriptional regulator n=1 Tax=Brevundimonas aveniformis TaxID=370977 RepID=UPI0004230190|nr:TetR/AcrR family transcriptional regulator [Brevundimonas aveniformis]
MNHSEVRGPFEAVEVTPRPLNRRQQAKARTRIKVMQAARELFGELGYDGATIRDIAKRAGMSTGAVFANFTDKTDLFEAIYTEDAETMMDVMRDAVGADATASVSKRLSALFSAGYGQSFNNLPMVRAVVVRSWLQGDDAEGRMRVQDRGLANLIAEVLRDGVKAGEIKADIDARLAAEMLQSAYTRNYRHALFDNGTLEQLSARIDDQVAMLLNGLKA